MLRWTGSSQCFLLMRLTIVAYHICVLLCRDSIQTSALEGVAAAKVDSNGNPVLRQIPRRVLDIGCGVPHWILSQAIEWKETEFVGEHKLLARVSNFTADFRISQVSTPSQLVSMIACYLMISQVGSLLFNTTSYPRLCPFSITLSISSGFLVSTLLYPVSFPRAVGPSFV